LLPHKGKADWSAESGELVHKQAIEIDYKQLGIEPSCPVGANLVTGSPEWMDYTLRCRVTRNYAPHSGLGFIVRYRDEANYTIVWADDGHTIDIWRVADGKRKRSAKSDLVRLPYGHTSHVDVQAIGDKVTFLINGRKVVEAADAALPAGRVGFCSIEQNRGRITDVQVLSGVATPDLPPLEVLKVPYILYVGRTRPASCGRRTCRPALVWSPWRRTGQREQSRDGAMAWFTRLC